MDSTKYSNIIKMLDDTAEKTQDAKIDEITSWVHKSLEEEHKPTLALVSFNLNHADRVNMLKKVFDIEIPKDIVHMIDGEPACLILDYCESPALLNENGIVGDRITFGVPSEQLVNCRIAICDELHSKDMWLELSSEIDAVCLLINATMAMNQMERNWIKECAAPFYDDKDIAVVITKMDRLNEEEDAQAVRQAVRGSLERLNVTYKTYEDESETLAQLDERLVREYDREARDRRVIKNGIQALTEHLKYVMDSVVIDSATIQGTIEQLEKQQKSLELAGQFATESILCNALNQLKSKICDGIRDYGRQMAANIKKKIEASPLDQLETMDDKINGYVSGSWEYYIKSMSKKADEEIEVIAQRLAKQMELDAGKMVSDLDESARRTVYSALGLSTNSAPGTALIDPRSIVQKNGSLSEISVGTVTDQLRKETRNMMLLSIPLFFVNPLVAVGNIFAAKVYGKYKTNSELSDIRSEMAKQVEQSCFDHSEAIVQQVTLSFDDEIRTGSINIKSAYNGLIRQIQDSLSQLQVSQGEKAELKNYLSNLVNVAFPGVLSNL